MQIDPARLAKWRERAAEYRTRADVSASPGTQLAFRALAECADSVADRLAQGVASVGKPDASAAQAPTLR